MKRLSLVGALSVLLMAGFATSVKAEPLAGSVLMDNGGAGRVIRVEDARRLSRFVADDRLDGDLNLSNRDFENNKPIEREDKNSDFERRYDNAPSSTASLSQFMPGVFTGPNVMPTTNGVIRTGASRLGWY